MELKINSGDKIIITPYSKNDSTLRFYLEEELAKIDGIKDIKLFYIKKNLFSRKNLTLSVLFSSIERDDLSQRISEIITDYFTKELAIWI
jgi:hypothetical protein